MRDWLIYEPSGASFRTLDDAEKIVTVREGFSKIAFFLAPAWLAYRRCWLALGLWAAAMAVVVALHELIGMQGGIAALFLTLPNLAVGYEAAWIRARKLERDGYTLAGAATGRNREEAEAAFFQDWLSERPAHAEPTAATHAPYRPTSSGVLGLFPTPGAAR